MKQLFEALRSASKIEILVIIIILCVLLVLALGGEPSSGDVSEEERLERILSRLEGAGKVSVMLSRDEQGIKGCVAAASGAGDMRVMLEMQRTLRTLTGLDLDQIEIVKSKR